MLGSSTYIICIAKQILQEITTYLFQMTNGDEKSSNSLSQ